jgi:hypothetical protein
MIKKNDDNNFKKKKKKSVIRNAFVGLPSITKFFALIITLTFVIGLFTRQPDGLNTYLGMVPA